MKIEKQLACLELLRTGEYSVNLETGGVFHHGKPITAITIPAGYLQYLLRPGFGSYFMAYGHQLVYLFRYGRYDPKLVIDHINGVKHDNRISNLRAVTQSENLQGDWRSRKRNFKPKPHLTPDQRATVFRMLQEGHKQVFIAAQLNTSRQTVAKLQRELDAA